MNHLSKTPRGTLAYSDTLGSLILFEFLPLVTTDGQKLHDFVQLFVTHAKAWIDALAAQTVPQVETEAGTTGSGMFGMS